MARLETFARSKHSCSHPIIGMLVQLKFYSLVDKKIVEQVSPTYIEPLTSEQFNVFHHEAAKEAELKTRLANLPWLRTQQKVPTTLLHSESSTYIVPQSMAEKIPPRKKRPRWIFRGHNIRAGFYKSKGLLLAQLNKSLALTDDIKNTEQFNNFKGMQSFLTDWDNIDNSLLRESQDISKKRQKLWVIFQNDTHQFLTEWQRMLFTWRQNILSQQLTIIENLLSFLETKINESESVATVFQHCEYLQQMLDLSQRTISTIFPKLGSTLILTATETSQIQQLKQKQEKLTQVCDSILNNVKLVRSFKRLASGNDLSQLELSDCLKWCECLRLNKNDLQAFKRTYSTEIDLIENQLKVKLLDIQNASKNKSLIIHLFKILEAIGSDTQRIHLSHRIQKYFLAYLKQLSLCTMNKKERLENIISSMEEVLTTLAPHQLFAGTTFQSHVETFKNLRNTKGKTTHLQAFAEGNASTLASQLLHERLEKDINSLEAQIERIMIDKLPCQQNIMSLLLQISDRLVETKQAHLEDIETGLSESDRVLAGLKSQELKPIKELIELHAFAKQTQVFCRSASNYSLQWKRLNELKQLGQKTFSNHPWALQFTLGRTKSGRNPLFHKTYWEPQVEQLKPHSLSIR